MKEVHTFGDSHAHFSFQNFKNFKVVPHWMGPWTMYRIVRNQPNFLDFIPKCDILITSFGEIDIRCHIHKYASAGADYLISNLAKGYVNALIKNKPNFSEIIICCPTPVCTSINTLNNPDYPFLGTDEERVEYRRRLIENIKLYAKDFKVLDATKHYVDDRGILRRELSDNNVHIRDTSFVEEELIKLIGV